MQVLLINFVSASLFYVLPARGEISCISEVGEGVCRASSDCQDGYTVSENCPASVSLVCCPLDSFPQIDRKITIVKTRRLKIRRPLIKMRVPVRSMIRRRKRRPLTKYTMMSSSRPMKPIKHMRKPPSHLLANKLVPNYQHFSKFPNDKFIGDKYTDEKPLSYYYSNQGGYTDSIMEDFITKQVGKGSSANEVTDMMDLHDDMTIELGEGKPSSSDLPMFPEEPDIFKESDLFSSMFRPKTHKHTSKRIAELKCEEYKSSTSETVAELTKFGMVPRKVEKCTAANIEDNNTPGMAKTAEFPHVAGLGYEEDGETVWGCSGALISEYYVLTAAHCIYSSRGRPVKVGLGKIRLDDSTLQELRISEVAVHPLYNATGRYNDIALVRLAKRVRFSDTARPACLQSDKFFQVTAVATHWQPTETMSLEVRLKSNLSTHRFSDGGDAVGLKKAPYTILDSSECGIPQDTRDSLLCTSTEYPGSTCSSEGGGGPLQAKQGSNRCTYIIIGLASMRSCEEPTMSIYTRVSHFLPWIESIAWV